MMFGSLIYVVLVFTRNNKEKVTRNLDSFLRRYIIHYKISKDSDMASNSLKPSNQKPCKL